MYVTEFWGALVQGLIVYPLNDWVFLHKQRHHLCPQSRKLMRPIVVPIVVLEREGDVISRPRLFKGSGRSPSGRSQPPPWRLVTVFGLITWSHGRGFILTVSAFWWLRGKPHTVYHLRVWFWDHSHEADNLKQCHWSDLFAVRGWVLCLGCQFHVSYLCALWLYPFFLEDLGPSDLYSALTYALDPFSIERFLPKLC